jgi:hypothetical protein
MLREEVPLILANLTPQGRSRAAMVGFHYLQTLGFSINRALELLGDTPKEHG